MNFSTTSSSWVVEEYCQRQASTSRSFDNFVSSVAREPNHITYAESLTADPLRRKWQRFLPLTPTNKRFPKIQADSLS